MHANLLYIWIPGHFPGNPVFGPFYLFGCNLHYERLRKACPAWPVNHKNGLEFSKKKFGPIWPILVLKKPKKPKKFILGVFCAYKWVPIIAWITVPQFRLIFENSISGKIYVMSTPVCYKRTFAQFSILLVKFLAEKTLNLCKKTVAQWV